MTSSVELVEKALRHEALERLPRGELFISEGFLETYCTGVPDDYPARLAEAARLLGLDLISVDLDRPEMAGLLRTGTWDRLAPFFSVACINGPFSRLVARLGFQEALARMVREPVIWEECAASLAVELEGMLGPLRERGFRAIATADDVAGNHGLFFSPELFERLMLPHYRHLAEMAQGAGLYPFFHTDGDTRSILDSLAGAGFTCLHPVEKAAGVDLYALARRHGTTLCFMGHIEVMGWSPEEVRREVARAEASFRNGGLILGSSCGIALETVGKGLEALYPGLTGRQHGQGGRSDRGG